MRYWPLPRVHLVRLRMYIVFAAVQMIKCTVYKGDAGVLPLERRNSHHILPFILNL